MIVESLIQDPMRTDIEALTDRYSVMVYDTTPTLLDHVMSLTKSGSTTFLFSGSWRLNVDANYLELKHYRQCQLNWHARTHFVDPENHVLYHYTLKRLASSNLIILHSDFWTNHRPIDEIILHAERLREFAQRVICTIPLAHSNFNKLTTSPEDLNDRYGGVQIIDDSIVLTR